jgi:hypothetical protein
MRSISSLVEESMKVYLETSFVSACVSTRTDSRSIYRRDISREMVGLESSSDGVFRLIRGTEGIWR